MKTLARISLFFALLLPCLLRATPQAQSFRVAPSYFPNKGQVSDKSVTWYSRGANVSLYLRGTTLTYVLTHRPKSASDDPMKRPHDLAETAAIVDRVDVELVGANPRYEVQAEAKQAGVFHFYLPQCSPGLRYVPHYGRVVCRDVWPGVDMVLGTQGEALKYDFVVRPSADAGQIRLRYAGQGPHLTPDGGLTRPTAAGDLRESAPSAWTTAPDGSRKPVAASWQLAEDGQPRFALGAYDAKQELTIDPVVWGMYLGGSGEDWIMALSPSTEGGVFAAGWTESIDFESLSGGSNGGEVDGFLACFSPEGNLNWGSYLGGGGTDRIYALCSVPNGGIFTGGWTDSDDFDGLIGGFRGIGDGFLTQFTTEGEFIRGSYLGGRKGDIVQVLCTASDGSVFAAGTTGSSDFEGISGGYEGGESDGFLMRFTSTGGLLWGKYIGGILSDNVNALCIAPDGGAYLGGTTLSYDFSGDLKGESDGFVAHFSASGSLIWIKCLGGNLIDEVLSLCRASGGGVFVQGVTFSDDFEGLNGSYEGDGDGFLMRFTASGELIWGKYFGGSGHDRINTQSLTPDGSVIAGGMTTSLDFKGLSFGFKGGHWDGFLVCFSEVGNLIWGSYLGGSNDGPGNGEGVSAVCLSIDTDIFVAGGTQSNDFEGLRGINKGDWDCFLLKHTGTPTARPAAQAPLPLSLAPNPAADQAHISLNLDAGGPAILEAYDAAGRLVHSRRLALQAGDNQIDLDLSGWPAGVYSVRLSAEQGEYAGRLVKN